MKDKRIRRFSNKKGINMDIITGSMMALITPFKMEKQIYQKYES